MKKIYHKLRLKNEFEDKKNFIEEPRKKIKKIKKIKAKIKILITKRIILKFWMITWILKAKQK